MFNCEKYRDKLEENVGLRNDAENCQALSKMTLFVHFHIECTLHYS